MMNTAQLENDLPATLVPVEIEVRQWGTTQTFKLIEAFYDEVSGKFVLSTM